MRRPAEVRYARAIDGAYIAYQAFGSGDPLLFISDGFIPIDFMDDEPRLADAMRRLATFSRVVRFDRRGVGGSDPVTPAYPPTLEQWVEDACAVLEAEDCRDAAVFGPADGGLIALTLAAIHPKRARSLVLVNAFAKAMSAPDHPWGLDRDLLQGARESTIMPDRPDSAFDLISFIAPSGAADPRFRRWWDRVGRRGASPATAQSFRKVIDESDVRSLLPTVETPTLVVQRADSRFSPRGQGEYLARSLSNATYVEFPGEDTLWWLGDQDQLLDRVEEFVTSRKPTKSRPRPYLTVLFTDIVDSTRAAVELGDRTWAENLERFLQRARIEVARSNGAYVRDTGDGILACFEGTVRAVQCASILRGAAEGEGLKVRSGVHAGEVELRGHDLAGLSVHVAARVQDLARSGEVLVTRSVANLLPGAGIELEPRGDHALRGIPGVWPLFAVAN